MPSDRNKTIRVEDLNVEELYKLVIKDFSDISSIMNSSKTSTKILQSLMKSGESIGNSFYNFTYRKGLEKETITDTM